MLRPNRQDMSVWTTQAMIAESELTDELVLSSPCPPPHQVLAHAAWLEAFRTRCCGHDRHQWHRLSPRTQCAVDMARAVLSGAVKLSSWAVQQSAAERRSKMTTDIIRATEAYDFKTGLLIIDKTGRGKTVGLAHLMLTAWERGFREFTRTPIAMVVKATDIAAARRCHPLGEGEPALLVAATEAELLLLDDLGQDSKHDNSVFEVLDARYDAQLPTVVTSGFPLAEISARYGQALVRRIIETNGDGKIVNLLGAAPLRAAK
jgi:DNA replication protein DnaC